MQRLAIPSIRVADNANLEITLLRRPLDYGSSPSTRKIEMSTLSRMIVAAVLCVLLCGCGSFYGPSETKTTLGTHPLTIVDTSEKPFGGTSGTRQDDAAGITIDFFESANGRYRIELENEVMTINGDKYTLENPTDSIRVVDGRVEINGVEAAPDTDVEDGGTVENANRDKAEAYFGALRKVQSVEEEEKLLTEFGEWLERNGYKISVVEKNGKHELSCPHFPPVTPWAEHSFFDVKNLELLPQ
jgi:hypothetical protein